MMAEFGNCLISGIFRVSLRSFFRVFFVFLCMMAHLENGLFSGIFRVFLSGFLHRTTLNDS